jgi:signal transduction histidine kinase/tetratricopeptide (TPR) repeat protein
MGMIVSDDFATLQRRMLRIEACARRHSRVAIALFLQLELRAANAHQHQVQLDSLYRRYFVKERLSEAHHLLDDLHSGFSLAEIYRLPKQAGQLLEALGRISYTLGAYKEAVRYWMDCIAACALKENNRCLIEARIGLGQVYDAIGDWNSAARFHLDAGALLQEIDDPYLHSKQAINLAVNQQHLGQLASARISLLAAVTHAERGGIAEYVAEAHWHLGKIALQEGEFTQAQYELNLALTLANACSYRWLHGAVTMSLAAMFEAQAQHDLAIDAYALSLQDAERVESATQQALCCAELSRLHEQRGEFAIALAYARRLHEHHEVLAKASSVGRFKELREVDLSQKPPVELLLDLSVDRQFDGDSFSTAVHTIAVGALKVLRIELICVWLLEKSSGSLVCHSVHSPGGLMFSVGDEFDSVSNVHYLQLLMALTHPLVAHDIRLHPVVNEVLNVYGQSGLKSLIEIPLHVHGEFVGIVSFGQCHQRRNWSRKDVLFGSHIAGLLQQTLIHTELTAALKNVKTEEENRNKAEVALQQSYDSLKERSADMLKLGAIGRELTATLNMEVAFERVYKQVIAKLDAFVFGIGIYDEAAQQISMVYLMENAARQPSIVFKMAEKSRPAVWCVREKRELIVAIRSELETYVGPLLPVLFGSGSMQSLVYLPLMVGGDVIGCLTIQSPMQHAFRADQLEFLAVLASYTAIAVSNSAAHGELAAAHKRTQETQQQLVLQEKMAGLGTLTAGVAHEINNPTNFVHVAVQNLRVDLTEFKEFIHQLMEGDEDPEILRAFENRFGKLNEHVATMLNGTERIKGIVKDLRSFTRLGEADKKNVRMSECLISTLNLVRTSWQDQINFVTDFGADPEINCWPALLNQVFMNLMVNGCQAIAEKQLKEQQAGRGTGKLKLSIKVHIEHATLMITFEDEGIGMAEETKSHVMEPFFTTKEVGAGTGLGLSIAYGIVERHGGTLTFTSSVGVGTCFTVALPMQCVGRS